PPVGGVTPDVPRRRPRSIPGDAVVSGTQEVVVARYNADGSLDDGTGSDTTAGDSFGTAGVAAVDFSGGDDHAYAVAQSPDGGVVLGGNVQHDRQGDGADGRVGGQRRGRGRAGADDGDRRNGFRPFRPFRPFPFDPFVS